MLIQWLACPHGSENWSRNELSLKQEACSSSLQLHQGLHRQYVVDIDITINTVSLRIPATV